MFSRFFGRKKRESEEEDNSNAVRDYSFLGADMHSHFIPGIDDGAQTIDDSITMLKAMQDMGYKSVVTTPHINFDHYPNSSSKILAGLQQVHHTLKEKDMDITVKAAAEYYIDDHFFQILEREPLLTIYQDQVLVEISMASQPSNLFEIMFNIQLKGYKPILAHPERYLYLRENRQIFTDLKDRGCMLQLNTLSLAGYYGGDVKDMALFILENKLYDYAGTDMHHMKHAELLQRFTQGKTFLKLQKYAFRNKDLMP
ncbi:MAG: histidinol phosphatase [Flavipsychrobacter sp.]|nr:histidinol phosphatase [Flavipsychrobacter sp.]